MADIVLEERVSKIEQIIERIGQKLEQGAAESNERLAHIENLLDQTAEENRRAAEENRQAAEENRRFAEENRRGIAELRQENRRGIAELRQELGNLSKRLGTIIEDFIAPDLPRILRSIVPCPEGEGVLVNIRVRRRHPSQKGRMIEIDALADCGQYVLCNETKSRLRPEYIRDFLDKLTEVWEYFPEYQQHQIIGCVASLHVDPSLVDHAARQGLFVLALGEGLMVVQNEPEFQWRVF